MCLLLVNPRPFCTELESHDAIAHHPPQALLLFDQYPRTRSYKYGTVSPRSNASSVAATEAARARRDKKVTVVTAHFAEIRNEAGLLDDLQFRDLCRIPATALGGDCGPWRHFRETGGRLDVFNKNVQLCTRKLSKT